jgi:hypothetical protein
VRTAGTGRPLRSRRSPLSRDTRLESNPTRKQPAPPLPVAILATDPYQTATSNPQGAGPPKLLGLASFLESGYPNSESETDPLSSLPFPSRPLPARSNLDQTAPEASAIDLT